MKFGSVVLRVLAIGFALATGILFWLLIPFTLLLLESVAPRWLPGVGLVIFALMSCALGLPALGAAFCWWAADYPERPAISTPALERPGTSTPAIDSWNRQREPSHVVEFFTQVAGGRRCTKDREAYIQAHCQIGDEVKLVRDKDNDFSKDAIAVLHREHHIGFLPTEITWKLSRQIDKGEATIEGRISDISVGEGPQPMQIVTVLVTQTNY